MTKISVRLALLFCCTAGFISAQTKPSPPIQQKAEKSVCSNIIALAGNVDIKCSSLTPEQKKALDKIPAILNKILAHQVDPDVVMQKLDEILQAASQPKQNFQCSGSNCGNTLINPLVNNFGPPPANLTFTEEVTQSLSSDGTGVKQMKIHIHTDRAIPGAAIGIVMSGPINMTKEYYDSHNPSQIGSGSSQVDMSAPLGRNGIPIPNSFGLKIGMPAAFYPGVDLVVPVESKFDVHVVQVAQITQ